MVLPYLLEESEDHLSFVEFMTTTPFGMLMLAFFAFAGFVTSCGIAQEASGNTKGCWAWGILGPVGWIIAALRGIQERL